MVVRKKVSLGGDGRSTANGGAQASTLELFFNTGVVFHEVVLEGGLPDTVVGFVAMKDAQGATSVRHAGPGEDPDVEVSPLDHLHEIGGTWLPVPYQLSCPLAVQAYLVSEGGNAVRLLLAIDTTERKGAEGRALDADKDEARPFRARTKEELGPFFDHPEIRDLVRKMERAGTDRALFKLAALLEVLAPLLPRVQFARIQAETAIPVSLVLDFGNSRSSALLVEPRDGTMSALPLLLRSFANPFSVTTDPFDSRVTFLPSPFDKGAHPLATGEGFGWPSIARLGREALDRALETPHRYAATLSGPKRYLWDARPVESRWYFAKPSRSSGEGGGEYTPIFGRLLKYVDETQGGLVLRQDGPSAPPDPRHAPRTMMLFALVEIVSQAIAQIGSADYRKFQGKEGNVRLLRHVCLTYPSAMPDEERQVYEALVRNAVILACHLLGIPRELWPNVDAQGQFTPFLMADEALASQLVYLFQEVNHTYQGSMEELVTVYGHADKTLTVASIDIGGGTTDVMVAEYTDKLEGTGTALHVKKRFQDGVNIAGDEVCRAIVEDVLFAELRAEMPSREAQARLVHLFGEGDAGHGQAWRTLRARLVPHLFMPLARVAWGVAEGVELPEYSPERRYSLAEIAKARDLPPFSSAVLEEADRFLGKEVPGFPGLSNLGFRFDRSRIERSILRVLREPLRRYADLLAQLGVDLVLLSGRASALPCVRAVFESEMPVSAPRIKSMAGYRVGEYYPSKWKDQGRIIDPKSTVAVGAAILHLATKNRLPGFLVERIEEAKSTPVYGLYQETEPHLQYTNELFPNGAQKSRAFVYTAGMRIGFRNVASQEMDGTPLLEVRPANAEVEAALLEDRVLLSFARGEAGGPVIAEVKSQRGEFSYEPTDFVLSLKTMIGERYWLDTGVLRASPETP